MRERYVIIPAGGSGRRMGADIPKQMLRLGGVPVLRRTLDLFTTGLPFEVHVIIPVNPSIKSMWVEYCRSEGLMLRYILVPGGMTRFHSVRKALGYVPDGALVAVHDAVRPLVRREDIVRLYDEGEKWPAVVPVLPVTDSMRLVAPDGSSSMVARDGYRLVQTPQVFHSEVLKNAYRTAFSPEFTDDASVVEKAGVPLHLCPGNRFNIKLTTPEDMALAETLLRAKTIL
ncbi:MAG TPA: 2-C-methyl-D-erythritol 4-phosphate cytidylyltransferase [Candidatus Coprenecus stercoravium]|uniref:2-C-methyl-D-erythritol 4-phosphate cytidylyltransferase n=1 Tax=Candidatus Coprenecus stercoravium TaxID=2840735 RepID=A0A9D2K8K4_9BACT|nr:2-C-methyl-D-erythritol 4-phosphate cytidylyltransferase [Candidatus Coprenecus stercoravium]